MLAKINIQYFLVPTQGINRSWIATKIQILVKIQEDTFQHSVPRGNAIIVTLPELLFIGVKYQK